MLAAPAVRRHETRHAHPARGRDPGQGLALAHPMAAVVALSHVALRRRHTRPGGGDLAFRLNARKPQGVAAWYQARAVPDRRTQSRVQYLERAQVDLERFGEGADGDVIRKLHGRVLGIRQPRQRSEILLRVAIDLERREKRDIKVPRRETEGRALVAFHDDRDVARAELILSAAQAAGPVIVGGHRERPAAQQPIVVEHQVGGRVSGAVGVQPFIDDAVHAHEALRRRGHELPQSRRPHFRVGGGIERRFDVRQRGDLDGHAVLLEHAGDVGLPSRRADQALVEPIRLSELEADPVDCIEIVARRGVLAEGVQYPPLMRAQVARLPGRKSFEQRRITRFGLGDPPLALPGRGVRIESQDLIDELEIPVVVDEAAVGGDLGIDPDPEAHIRLELRRVRKRFALLGLERAAREQRRHHRA